MDAAAVEAVRRAVFAASMIPLLVGPHGGEVAGMTVQRTFATARSVEFDALLLAARPAPAPDALVARDEKAGVPGPVAIEPRVALMVDEVWRQSKAIGAGGAGAEVVEAGGYVGSAGVVVGEDATDVAAEVQGLTSGHRVWRRFEVEVA